MKNNIAKNIKQLRTNKLMKQSDLSQILKVTVKTISHWETGYSEPSINQLIELSSIFGVTIDTLICK